jgi:hypothetical protein
MRIGGNMPERAGMLALVVGGWLVHRYKRRLWPEFGKIDA